MRKEQQKRRPKGNRKWRVTWAKVQRHARETHKLLVTIGKILGVSIANVAKLTVLIRMIGC